jgi:hypothetical protein
LRFDINQLWITQPSDTRIAKRKSTIVQNLRFGLEPPKTKQVRSVGAVAGRPNVANEPRGGKVQRRVSSIRGLASSMTTVVVGYVDVD